MDRVNAALVGAVVPASLLQPVATMARAVVRWNASRVALRTMDHGRITRVGRKLDAEG